MAPRWLSTRQSAWDGSAREPSVGKSTIAIAAVIFLAGLLLGYVVKGIGGEGGSANAQPSPVIDPVVTGMTKAPQTAEGAVSAVTSFISGFPAVALLTPQQQTDILDSILYDKADPNIRTDLTEAINGTRVRLVGPPGLQRQLTAKLIIAPASYRIDMLAPDRARVQVWYMTVLVDSNGPTSESIWATNDIQVQWTDHWRIATYAARGGPTPALLNSSPKPSSFEEVNGVISGFKAYRYATATPQPSP